VEFERQKRIGKFDMWLQSNEDVLSKRLWKHGVWEPIESIVCQRFVERGHVAVDVGAHIGYWTLLMSHWVGQEGQVVAFEPETHNFLYLGQNVALNNLTNTKIERRAVSNAESELVKLHLTGNNGGHHSLFEIGETTSFQNVQQVSLDSYFESGDRVDFVKIDTEGNEVMVLLGMQRVIEDNPDVVVMAEFSQENFDNANYDLKDFYNMLREFGFDVWMILHGTKTLGLITDDNLDWVIEYKEQGLPFRNILCTRGEE